ncbi:hypothetical protein Ahy_B05g078899 [Arachis hypogaea]|uniref:Uncharacterized protein n=1 Tax=Arachis hypogaea TaxID=3818 RepID=A0A444Z8H3_ARAHY|nr:hypothetical protein Ahy_B05g078899 [Arachis hypogaea]
MASTSNAAGSSNNPRSFGSIMRRINRNREARLPEWCACGSRPIVGKKWCGLFMWVDKVLEDAMPCDDRTRHSVDDEEWKMKMA